MNKEALFTHETLTRIGRLEELLIWIINNNQNTGINLPNEDVFEEMDYTASVKAAAEMERLKW